MRLARTIILGLTVSIAAASAGAEDWTPLTGDDIEAALSGQKLQYDTAWQEFRASGRTLYNAGLDSWGYWAVRGDQYCSQWPPADGWACYDMARRGDWLRFIGESGAVTDGQVVE